MALVIDPTLLIEASTRDNYVQVAKKNADANGTTVAAEWANLIKSWENQHQGDALAGWDRLAQWGKSVDPAALGGSTVDPLELLKVRAIESEKRDPSFPTVLDLTDPEVIAEVEHARVTSEPAGVRDSGKASIDPATVDSTGDAAAERQEERASAKAPRRNTDQAGKRTT